MTTPHGKQIKMLKPMSLKLTGEKTKNEKKRSITRVVVYFPPQRAENCKFDEHVSTSISFLIRPVSADPGPFHGMLEIIKPRYERSIDQHRRWGTDTIIPNSGFGKSFSSIAQLNACGNLQMTEMSRSEGGGRVRQKVFLRLVFDFWKPQLSPTQLGSMRQDPGTHAPRKHYILLKLKSQSVDSFFCLSV